MFNGYFSADSECLCWFTGRKLRQNRPHEGPASLGICESNDDVAEVAIRLMGGSSYRGIVDMGFRYDAQRWRVQAARRQSTAWQHVPACLSMNNGIDVLRAQH